MDKVRPGVVDWKKRVKLVPKQAQLLPTRLLTYYYYSLSQGHLLACPHPPHIIPSRNRLPTLSPPPRQVYDRIANGNYSVELGLGAFKFSLVSICGKDLVDANLKLILALVWQVDVGQEFGLTACSC